MAFKASNVVPQGAYALVKGAAVQLKLNVDAFISQLAAQGSGVQICVTSLMIYNASATDTYVNIKDGSTTKLVIPAPKAGGAIITLPMPLVLTANTALNFASGTSVTTMYVSAVGYKWTSA